MENSGASHKFSLNGRVALVTGASSGLGAHFARVLASQGAKVVVGARRVDRLNSIVDEIRDQGGMSMAVALDVTDAESVDSALEQIQRDIGIPTILVNNAGVADSRHCLKVDESSWDFVMDVNLKGAWRVSKSVAKLCVDAGERASIVNVASILGIRVGFGESAYATSKAALVQLTKAMALELSAKGIRVNALCPGYFATEMNAGFLDSEMGMAMLAQSPSRRSGKLTELDGPLLLLASDAGSFVSGVTLPVDGGHLVSSL